jgi:hypothetical protein
MNMDRSMILGGTMATVMEVAASTTRSGAIATFPIRIPIARDRAEAHAQEVGLRDAGVLAARGV